ncbi:MAG: GAF domain-containing protein [Caldilineaceae bacterium]|nr:GAF domain-containing protein [Caldilineaceae bacterium]
MIRVLILDDEPNYCAMLKESIEEEDGLNVIVETAQSLKQAVQLVEQNPEGYDVFLIDFQLRDRGGTERVDGLYAVKTLRALAPEAEAIILTGHDEPNLHVLAYQAGASRYLVKPFELRELTLILQSIDGLKILHNIARQTQTATTVREVADVLVRQGVSLGFERARFFLVDKQLNQLRGITQIGLDSLRDFSKIAFDIDRSPYAHATATTGETRFFYGLELGKNALSQDFDEQTFPRPVGEWVDIALGEGEECIGVLALDNYKEQRTYHAEQRRILRLLSHHATAAVRRALQHEEEAYLAAANHVVQAIIQEAAPQGGTLPALLKAMYNQLQHIAPTQNFVVVLKHRKDQHGQREWLQIRLHVEDGDEHTYSLRKPERGGLTEHMFEIGQPRYFPYGTLEYRCQHGLPEPQDRLAQSLMAIPIRLGSEAIGLVLIEEYEHQEQWTQDQFERCCAVTEQLTSLIHVAWLNQQLSDFVNPLSVLQHASETIIELAQMNDNEEWLWHGVLTLITAGYGFCFDRAMLFLRDRDDNRWVGRMGIGHLSWQEAEKAWKQDAQEGLDSFDKYVNQLKKGTLRLGTPVDKEIRGMEIMDSDASAFTEVIKTGKYIEVPREKADVMLPRHFLDTFHKTDYALVPLKAGEHIIGIVVMDTIWGKEPQNRAALNYIDTLTNEAALVCEILHANRAQKTLIELPNQILPNAGQKPLKESLGKIGEAARYIMRADSVSIYPLKVDLDPEELDLNHAIWVDGRSTKQLKQPANLSEFMRYLVNTQKPIYIEDVHRPHPSGIVFEQDVVVQEQGIRAFIGLPILGPVSKKVRGLLYLNFNHPRSFNEHDVFQAQTFANLAAVVLRNWRETEGLRNTSRTRGAELTLMHDVLTKALSPKVNQAELIEALLRKTRELLRLPAISIAIILREWKPPNNQYEQAEECWHQYFLQHGHPMTEGIYPEINGLCAQALQRQRTISTPNVHTRGRKRHYYDRKIDTKSEVDVPILSDEHGTLGIINVESPIRDAFPKDHIEFLERQASLAALVLGNLIRHARIRTIVDAAQTITEPTELKDTLEGMVRAVRAVVPEISMLTLWHRDLETQRMVLGQHFGVYDVMALQKDEPKQNGIVNQVMKREEPLWAEDLQNVPLLRKAEVIKREELSSTAAFPLHIQGEAIGALFLSYRKAHVFTEAEQNFLKILARFVAIGVNDALLFNNAETQRKRNKASTDIAAAIGGELEFEQMIEQIQVQLKTLYSDCRTSIVLVDQDEQMLNFTPFMTKYYPITHPDFQDRQRIPLNAQSYAGALVLLSSQQGQKLMSNIPLVRLSTPTYKSKPEYDGLSYPDEFKPNYLPLNKATRSQFTITLYSERLRCVLGVLVIESSVASRFSDEDESVLYGVAKQIRFALERHHLLATIALPIQWPAPRHQQQALRIR